MQISANRVRQDDRLLAPNQEPPLGAHLLTPRFGFTHHGIYVGDGKVVHYGALGAHVLGGPVEEVSLTGFTRGRSVWVRSHRRVRFEWTEVIRRARSRVGEDCYRVFTNNCEHFCEWCLQGEQRSYQVESLLALPKAIARLVRTLAANELTRGTGALAGSRLIPHRAPGAPAFPGVDREYPEAAG